MQNMTASQMQELLANKKQQEIKKQEQDRQKSSDMIQRLPDQQQDMVSTMRTDMPSFAGIVREGKPEVADPFPALEKDAFGRPVITRVFNEELASFNIMGVDTSLGGIQLKSGAFANVDNITKQTPEIKMNDLYDFSQDTVRSLWQDDVTAVFRTDGSRLPMRAGLSWEEKTRQADLFGATMIEVGGKEGTVAPVPYSNYVLDQITMEDRPVTFLVPKLLSERSAGTRNYDMQTKMLSDLTEDELDDFLTRGSILGSFNISGRDISGMPIGQEERKKAFANIVNRRLVRAGMIDPRKRANMIQYAISAPGMGDLEKIMFAGVEANVKFPIAVPMYFVGETLDILDEVGRIFGAGEDDENLYFDIRSSEKRQTLLDDLFGNFTEMLIARMAQRGVTISLADAEAYASTMTGAVPRMAKLAAEILPLSRALLAREVIKSEKEANLFDAWARKKIDRGEDVSDIDSVAKEWAYLRSAKQIKDEGGNIVGTQSRMFQKVRESIVTQRIRQGVQQREAKAPPELRQEVITQRNYIAALEARQRTVQNRINAGKNTVDDYVLNEKLQRAIDLENHRLTARSFVAANDRLPTYASRRTPGDTDYKPVITKPAPAIDLTADAAKSRRLRTPLGGAGIIETSGVPRYMTDWKNLDTLMIVGAGTLGQVFQLNLDDEEASLLSSSPTGELFGLGAAIATDIMFRNKNAAAAFLKTSPMSVGRIDKLNPFYTKEGHKKYLLDMIANYSPELQEALRLKALEIDEIYTPLIEAGMNEQVISLSFAQVAQLTRLQVLENQLRLSISTGNIKRGDEYAQALDDISNQKNDLIEQLREVLYNIGEVESNTPKGDFFRLVDSAINGYEKTQLDLEQAIKIVAEDGVQFFIDKAKANPASVVAKKLNNVEMPESLEAALKVLQSNNIRVNLNLPEYDFKPLVTRVGERVANDVTFLARRITSELGSLEHAKMKTKEFRDTEFPNGIIARGAREPASIQSAASEGDLISITFEAKHSVDRAIVLKGYQSMGTGKRPVTFYSGDNNQPVSSGALSVDISDVFKSAFTTTTEAGVTQMRLARGEGLTTGVNVRQQQIFKEISDPFFLSIADEGDSIEDTVNKLAKSYGIKKTKGENLQLQVINAILDENSDVKTDIFMVSSNQIVELEKTLRSISYNKKLEKLPDETKKYKDLADLTASKLNDMVIVGEDGTQIPFSDLKIRFVDANGQEMFVPVSQHLRNTNLQYADYKSRWFDKTEGNPIPDMMSWNTRVVKDVTTDNITGIAYDTKPILWYNPETLINKSADELVPEFKALAAAIGKQVTLPGELKPQYVLPEGDPFTDAFVTQFQAQVARYLIGQNDKLSLGEALEKFSKLDEVFVIMDADGKMKPMINITKIFDNTHPAFHPKSIGQARFDQEIESARLAIKKAIEEQTEPAEAAVRNAKLAVTVLRRYAPGVKKESDIAPSLLDMGQIEINKVKSALRKEGNLTDEQVNNALASIYLDSMQNLFKDTGQTNHSALNKLKPTLTKEYDVQMREFYKMLGDGDPEKVATVKNLIGKDKYRIWTAAYKALAKEEGSPAFRAGLTGIPRTLSPESYASRLYAWQRGAVGLRWIGTESIIQAARLKNFNMLKAALTDPEMGSYFIELVRTGKPFSLDREPQFRKALLRSIAAQGIILEDLQAEETFQDKFGRNYVLNPSYDTLLKVEDGKKIPVATNKSIKDFRKKLPTEPSGFSLFDITPATEEE